MNTGELVFVGLVVLGAAIGLIMFLACHKAEPETEQEWLDRQW